MQVEFIIIQAENVGVELSLAGDRIAARPKTKLSADLRELIKTNRQEIVRYLSHKNQSIYRASQSELVRLAILSGESSHGCLLHEKEVSALIPPSDYQDSARCEMEELKAWADALAMRAVRYRGKVPVGWGQIAHCAQCGPVYSFASGDCLACPWCEIRRAGKAFPVPDEDESQ